MPCLLSKGLTQAADGPARGPAVLDRRRNQAALHATPNGGRPHVEELAHNADSGARFVGQIVESGQARGLRLALVFCGFMHIVSPGWRRHERSEQCGLTSPRVIGDGTIRAAFLCQSVAFVVAKDQTLNAGVYRLLQLRGKQVIGACEAGD